MSGCLARQRGSSTSTRAPCTARRPGQSGEIASSDPNNLTNSPGREKSDILIVIVIFALILPLAPADTNTPHYFHSQLCSCAVPFCSCAVLLVGSCAVVPAAVLDQADTLITVINICFGNSAEQVLP